MGSKKTQKERHSKPNQLVFAGHFTNKKEDTKSGTFGATTYKERT